MAGDARAVPIRGDGPGADASAERQVEPSSVEMITDDRRLAALCAELEDEPVVGLDTEFVRTRTFYPQLGLIQIAWSDEYALIDALAIENWQPFARLLVESPVVKVLHSPSEDLEVFQQLVGGFPRPLFDTQIAATLAGHGSSLGYQRLVAALCGVEIAKGEQRSDWLRRPLSSSQIHYAALDVVYLLGMAEELGREVEELGRWSWLLEEMESSLRIAAARLRPEPQFRRLARVGMRSEELQALFALNAWREAEARSRDRPRRFVVEDEALLQLARQRPEKASQLRRIRALSPKQAGRYGERLREVVANAAQEVGDEYLEWMPPAPLKGGRSTEHKQLLEKVRAALEGVGERLALPADFLLTRRQADRVIEAARRKNGWTEQLGGWRAEVLREPLAAVFSSIPTL